MSEKHVRELAQLSILSNRISEVHKKNMKSYPYIVFNGFVSADVDYDLERGNKNFVSYNITLKTDADNPFMEKRLDALDKSIKNLFWKEVGVIIKINGEKKFDSSIQDTK